MKVFHRHPLLGLFLAVITLLPSLRAQTPPNVLFIAVDDLDDWIG